MSKTIETEVPKFKSLLVATLAKRIQFRMHLIEKIAVLLGNRMSLHLIRAHGYDTPLV
jgi:hypothetical protein